MMAKAERHVRSVSSTVRLIATHQLRHDEGRDGGVVIWRGRWHGSTIRHAERAGMIEVLDDMCWLTEKGWNEL